MNDKKISIHEFSWTEMMNNSTGKTSPTRFIGTVCCLVSLFAFLITSIILIIALVNRAEESSEYLNVVTTLVMQSIILFSAGATLLLGNRLSKNHSIEEPVNQEK